MLDYKKIYDECKAKLSEFQNLDERILIKIYPFDSASRIQAKQLALKKGGKFMADHCQISINNPVLQGAPENDEDVQRMKFFTTDHLHKFITKQWGVQSSKKYKVKLRFCQSYHALIQHT